MGKHRYSLKKPIQLLTGKHGTLLLTALNVCLACLIITLSNYWSCLDITHNNTDYMTFFLPDYRIGFVSRALVGSVIYLFTDHPTVRMISTMLFIAVFCSCMLFCWMQAVLAKKALLSGDYATLLLSYLFFLSKSFWCNAFLGIGLLDIFMTLLLQLFLLCIERKRTVGYVLAPIVCFAGLLIHTAFFFVGFPVAAAILWLELLKSGRPNRICAVFFTAVCVVSVALFLMFTIFPQVFVRVTPDELLSMLKEKYDGEIQDTYFISHMFRTNGEKYADTIRASGFLEYATSSTNIFSTKIIYHFVNLTVLSVPFVYGCLSHARRSGNRKIAYLGFIAPLVTLFPSLHFSTDKERFFSLCLLALYMLLHYVVTQTDAHFLPCADDPPQKKLSRYEAQQRREKHRRALIVCTVAGLVFTLVMTQKL